MNTVPERPDQPVELCDLCGTRIAQDSGYYERVHDPASDRDIVLTACARPHLDDLVRQYTSEG